MLSTSRQRFTFFFCLSWLFKHVKTTYGLTSGDAGLLAALPLLGGAAQTLDALSVSDRGYAEGQANYHEPRTEESGILREIEPDATGNTPKEDLAPVVEQYGLVTPGDAHVYEVTTTGTVTDRSQAIVKARDANIGRAS